MMQWYLEPKLKEEFDNLGIRTIGRKQLWNESTYMYMEKAEYCFDGDWVLVKFHYTEPPSFTNRDWSPVCCKVKFNKFRKFCLEAYKCEPVGGPTDIKVNWKKEGF